MEAILLDICQLLGLDLASIQYGVLEVILLDCIILQHQVPFSFSSGWCKSDIAPVPCSSVCCSPLLITQCTSSCSERLGGIPLKPENFLVGTCSANSALMSLGKEKYWAGIMAYPVYGIFWLCLTVRVPLDGVRSQVLLSLDWQKDHLVALKLFLSQGAMLSLDEWYTKMDEPSAVWLLGLSAGFGFCS